MLRVVIDEPERAPALLAEFSDLMEKFSTRAGGGESQDTRPGASAVDQKPDGETTFFRGLIGKLLTKKVPSDLLKMIAHLSTPKEWILTFELSANMVVFGGKGGISVNFGK